MSGYSLESPWFPEYYIGWIVIGNCGQMTSIAGLILYQTFDESCQNKNLVHKIMAGQKKKQRYSDETAWFPEYYIGWIRIGNYGQKTSNQ